MTEVSPTTGDRVRGALAMARIKQAVAAAELGLSQPQLSKRIAGHIPWRAGELVKLARLCHVSVASLLPEDRAA